MTELSQFTEDGQAIVDADFTSRAAWGYTLGEAFMDYGRDQLVMLLRVYGHFVPTDMMNDVNLLYAA